PIVSSERSPDNLTFRTSAPIRAARLMMSARGMTLSIEVVFVMVFLSNGRDPCQATLRKSPIATTTAEPDDVNFPSVLYVVAIRSDPIKESRKLRSRRFRRADRSRTVMQIVIAIG